MFAFTALILFAVAWTIWIIYSDRKKKGRCPSENSGSFIFWVWAEEIALPCSPTPKRLIPSFYSAKRS